MELKVLESGPPRDGLTIYVFNGDVEQALKKLKKQCLLTGLFKELKRRVFYMKPGERKRRKSKEAQKKRSKQQRAFEARDHEAPGTKNQPTHFNRRPKPTDNLTPTNQGELR